MAVTMIRYSLGFESSNVNIFTKKYIFLSRSSQNKNCVLWETILTVMIYNMCIHIYIYVCVCVCVGNKVSLCSKKLMLFHGLM
jgi:hypothetical protein